MTQKLVEYQSQDVLKNNTNLQVDKKDTYSEFVSDKQNSLIINMNTEINDDETKLSK